MSKYYYTSDEIIKSVKRRIVMPTSQNLFTDQDLLDFGTEEINLGMVPMILAQQEDYFLYDSYIPLEANKSKYAIPYRATGNKVREVAYVDQNNNLQEMTRIGVGDLPYYNNSNSYYISNNEICMVSENLNSQPSGSLKVTYYIRPNTLVPLSEVGVITNINRTTGVITVNKIPTKFTTIAGGTRTDLLLDLIMVKSPHKTLKFDITPILVDIVLNTITIAIADIPDSLVAGDHLSEATESAIPQIPSDLHVMLAHRVATRCLEALGDTEGLTNANQKLAEMEKRAMDVIDDRVEDSPQKIVKRSSLLRGGLNSRRFGR